MMKGRPLLIVVYIYAFIGVFYSDKTRKYARFDAFCTVFLSFQAVCAQNSCVCEECKKGSDRFTPDGLYFTPDR
jgi:hypothetical protein